MNKKNIAHNTPNHQCSAIFGSRVYEYNVLKLTKTIIIPKKVGIILKKIFFFNRLQGIVV